MIRLYLFIGSRLATSGASWGDKAVERLAADLRREFPDMHGLSRTNLVWSPAPEFVQQVVGRIPWGHHIALVSKVQNDAIRTFYLRKAAEEGWGRAILTHKIESRYHEPRSWADGVAVPECCRSMVGHARTRRLQRTDTTGDRRHLPASRKRDVGGYPPLRLTCSNPSMRLAADMAFGSFETSESVLAEALVRRLPAKSLTLFDRGIYSYETHYRENSRESVRHSNRSWSTPGDTFRRSRNQWIVRLSPCSKP